MTSTKIQLFTAEHHAIDPKWVSLQRHHAHRVSWLLDLPCALT